MEIVDPKVLVTGDQTDCTLEYSYEHRTADDIVIETIKGTGNFHQYLYLDEKQINENIDNALTGFQFVIDKNDRYITYYQSTIQDTPENLAALFQQFKDMANPDYFYQSMKILSLEPYIFVHTYGIDASRKLEIGK